MRISQRIVKLSLLKGILHLEQKHGWKVNIRGRDVFLSVVLLRTCMMICDGILTPTIYATGGIKVSSPKMRSGNIHRTLCLFRFHSVNLSKMLLSSLLSQT